MVARFLKSLSVGVVGVSAVAVWPALAHHSYAPFDRTLTRTIEGTVKSYRWAAPHVWLDIIVEDEQGNPVDWGIEMQSPGLSMRKGFRNDTFKPGDKVTLIVNPMRNGTPGGLLEEAILADGSKIGMMAVPD